MLNAYKWFCLEVKNVWDVFQTSYFAWRCLLTIKAPGSPCSSPAFWSSLSSPGSTMASSSLVASPQSPTEYPLWWASRTHTSWRPLPLAPGVGTSSLPGWSVSSFPHIVHSSILHLWCWHFKTINVSCPKHRQKWPGHYAYYFYRSFWQRKMITNTLKSEMMTHDLKT